MVARNYSSTAAETQLSEACTGSATVLRVASIVGFPPVPFTLIVDADTVYEEIVTVSAIAGTNLTVVRGEDGTTGLPHEVGATVRHGYTARDAREAANHIDATANVHGVGASSAVVGTNTTQTLKNKTLDASNSINTGALPTEVQVARLRLSSTSDASSSSTGHALQIGPTDGNNLRIDADEIVSLNAGALSTLSLRDNSTVLVPDPVGSTSAATKGYVDSAVAVTSTTGFGSSASGWATSSTAYQSRIWRQGKRRDLFLEQRRTGGQLSPGASGGIANTETFVLSNASDRPAIPIVAAATYNSDGAGDYPATVTIYPADGSIQIIALAPNVNLLGGVGAGGWSLRICATWYVD